MIFIADNSWLTGIVCFGVMIVVGVIAFAATRRWGWKAWPLLLCSALLVPVLAYAAAVAVLYCADRMFGLAGGFVVHTNWLVLIILVPTAIGGGVGSTLHRRPADDR
ncbi:hypothetical protein [Novosphingobium sp. KA1]|uniref:hypothetical protein n=1 Tax=Novosphingobium sp. (strain KA1) TaxID=164608 RepID=UPI001A908600|nr:hypothetical protein [Novosphingobium sp. KA1]QSR17481.1 hypothetical protein CA833_09845 [Novosphingobium sp. KA1]